MSDTKVFDKEYMNSVKEKTRTRQINEINRMLVDMDENQVKNIYEYTSDEYAEPDHESAALKAIIQLSREKQKNADESDTKKDL